MHELGILMLRLFRMPANIGTARLQLDLATGDPAAMMSQKHKPRTAENNPVLHIFCFVTGFPHNDGQIIATESRDNPKCSHKIHI